MAIAKNITTKTKKDTITISRAEYESLKERVEDLMDALAAKTAAENAEEFFPMEVARRIHNGESPVKVFREHRGLSQDDLANTIGKSKTTISEIERGRKNGSIETMKAIATALAIDLDDLV